MGLPKALIKKYGVSKKAWAVYRQNNKKVKVKTTTPRGYFMARKKASKRRSTKTGGFGKVIQIVIGAGIASLYEVFISPRIPLARNIKNMLELAIGVFLSFQRNTMMKSAGVALIVINTFEIIVPMLRNMGGKSSAVSVDDSGVSLI